MAQERFTNLTVLNSHKDRTAKFAPAPPHPNFKRGGHRPPHFKNCPDLFGINVLCLAQMKYVNVQWSHGVRCTVEPRLTCNTVTSLLRPLFWPPGYTFSCKKTFVNTVTRFFGPLVTVLTGFHCINPTSICRTFTVTVVSGVSRYPFLNFSSGKYEIRTK